LASHARQRPDAAAISDGQTVCTYRSLAIHVVQLLDALVAPGVRRDQVVGIETNDRFPIGLIKGRRSGCPRTETGKIRKDGILEAYRRTLQRP
jgi:hypothetical protein